MSSPVDATKKILVSVLSKHIKGKNAEARVEAAANDAVAQISHLITIEPRNRPGRLGATVMTHGASMMNGPARNI